MQYAHTHKLGYGIVGTLALDVPTKELLQEQLFKPHANQLMVMAGFSVVSKHDQFTKKTGRDIADSRKVPLVAHLNTVNIVGTKHIYRFELKKLKLGFKEYDISFALSTVAEGDGVNLISAFISDQEDGL